MPLPRNRVLAWRVTAIVVTLAALSLAARRVSSLRLLETFAQVQPGWFALAVLVNGLLFLPAALRWHIVLRLTGQAVDYAATLRSALAGHFFYVGLFGALGGDSARSIYYSRWYGRPLPSVLATAPLDRMLGLAGLVLFAAAGIALALGYRGLEGLHYAPSHNPLLWVAVPVALVLIAWVARRAAAGGFISQLFDSIGDGIRQLWRNPRLAIRGIGCGFLVQASLSGILALNLEAVSPAGINWGRLAWTLPLISLVGGLPVTVAGLGTREAAAVALLGLYGIASETAMAASLLCLASTLLWAVCGGVVFWREDRLARCRELATKSDGQRCC